MRRSRTALLIAFHYPPCSVSSGLQRSLAFSRHLSEYGWNAVVLTVTGCEGDGQSGIPTESPEPTAAETVEETTTPATAPTVVVGDVPGNPAATAALPDDRMVRATA